ncbi:DsbA family oxidoreductase [Lysobacter panacisoli]|uniref:DsbA family protein n=1 Tax=Lysobacter panacisoli TaxID=1255263 RepID=A0ABP9L8S4_9GAMM|nr:DsbA family oxidoreductase [Lysobacter panacisoli]
MNTQQDKSLHLQVVADLICPWCFIGKRGLDRALVVLARDGIAVDVEWLPYQLNPTMPASGMDRKQFRTQRFGWENALAMDARAVDAGRRVGADFRYDRQSRTPNTLAAHRLSRLAWNEGGASLQDRLVDLLFVAYFTLGEDIGNTDVLELVALEAGMSPDAVARSRSYAEEVTRLESNSHALGINGVPSYLVDGHLVLNGSTSIDGYVRAITDAATRVT